MKIRSTSARTFTWVFVKNFDGGDASSSVALKNDWAKVYHLRITNTKNTGAVSCEKCPKGSNSDG